MGSVGEARGKLALLAALLVLGGLHQFIYKPSLSDNTGDAEQAPPRSLEEGESQDDDKEDFALFTHANNELHCMERELRHPCVVSSETSCLMGTTRTCEVPPCNV